MASSPIVSCSAISHSLWPHGLGPLASSVHEISLTRIQEWVANSFSWDLPDPGVKARSSTLQAYSLPPVPWRKVKFSSVQFSHSVCPALCNPMNCSSPGLPVHHQLPEPTQTHVHWVGDAIQPSHPLWSPSPPALNLSQHQGLFKWVSSSHEVAKVLEFQLQHQSFQWTSRTDLL